MPIAKKRRISPADKRTNLRETFWPGSGQEIWSRHSNDGFTTIPRLLPLVMTLIKSLGQKGDSSSVYFDLWSRAFDEGIVSSLDPLSCAFSSGYSGTRAERTWREHVFQLRDLGFIRVKADGLHEIGHILLLDPLQVCAKLYSERPKEVTEEWWTAFVRRANEIGAVLPILF